MDVSLLSRIIKELILKNDRVGLPGMGTFVAEMIPASFSDKGYTINPPYRRLSFFSAKLEEDLLVDFYAESNGIDRAAAKTYIEHYIKDLKAVLLDRKTVVLPELGRLRATKDNTFFFVPDEDLDIFPEGFSLAPVSLKTHVETPEEIAISVTNLAHIMESGPEVAPEPVRSQDSDPDEEPLLVVPADEPADRIEPLPGVDLPEPAPETASQPLPGVDLPESAPEPEPAPAPELEPEPEPEPAPESAPYPEPVPEPQQPDPEPQPALEPQQPEPQPAPQPEPSRVPTPVPTPRPAPRTETSKPRKKCRWWLPILLVLCVAFILLALFLVLASVAPDFVDSILYTPEELRIINY